MSKAKTEPVMSLEQFQEFAKTLPEGADEKKVAHSLGVELPVIIPSLDEQLAQAYVRNHELKATKTREANTRQYLYFPALKLDEKTSMKPMMVNTRVARKFAERMIALCDENDL